jgi:hypothetical protein
MEQQMLHIAPKLRTQMGDVRQLLGGMAARYGLS